MDLKKKFDERFEIFCNENKADEIIDLELKRTVTSVIEDILNWEMKKDIKEQLREILKFDFSKYDFEPTIATMSGIIKAVLQETLTKDIAEKTHKHIESIVFGEVKTEFKLSEIIEEMLADKDEGEEITLHIDDDNDSFIWVSIDKDEDVQAYACEYRILFYKGEISSITIGSKDIYKHLAFEKHIHGMEKILCTCYFQDSKLILDEGTDADDYTTKKEYDY